MRRRPVKPACKASHPTGQPSGRLFVGILAENVHKALVRTNDWICHSGPEPELYLDGTPMTVQTLFHLMTKFDQDLMRDVEIQLTFEILGDVWEAQPPSTHIHRAATRQNM